MDVVPLRVQCPLQFLEAFEVCLHPIGRRIDDEDHTVDPFEDEVPGYFVKRLSRNRIDMKPRLVAADFARCERQKIEEQGALVFASDFNELSFLVWPNVLVDVLDVRGFPAQARAVVNDLAVDLLSFVIDEAHSANLHAVFHRFTDGLSIRVLNQSSHGDAVGQLSDPNSERTNQPAQVQRRGFAFDAGVRC